MSGPEEHEFDALMSRSGLDVPPELRAGVLVGYLELRRMAALVRGRRSAEAEPSAVYRIDLDTEAPRG